MTDVMGLYNAILNVTDQLVGRKVVRANSESDNPPVGKIVAIGSDPRSRLWVVWPHTNGEPTPHHARELLAFKENSLEKSLKWHGKRLAELEDFLRQVRAEGGNDDTELNPNNEAHVAIRVSLPLVAPSAEPPKHDHEFTVACVSTCPAFGYYERQREGYFDSVKDKPGFE